MKQLIIISEEDFGAKLERALADVGYHPAAISSTGGFLKKGNTTLLLSAPNDELEEIYHHIELCVAKYGKYANVPNRADATVFVLAQSGRWEMEHDLA